MITMKAPSTITQGSKLYTPDGAATTVDAYGYVSVDQAFVSILQNAGFTVVQAVTATPVAILKTSVGVTDLLAAAPVERKLHIVVTVDEVFANGSGAQPTLSIGEESGSASKFAATSKFTSAAAAATIILAGVLTANKKLQATSVAATGTATGGVTIVVIAVA